MSQHPIMDACLSLWGNSMDPSYITEELRINPTRFYIKDKPVASPRGKEFTPKTSVWEFKLSFDEKSLPLDGGIEVLLSKLNHLRENVKSLDGVQGAHINCVIGVKDEDDTLEIGLSSDLMRRLGELNIDLKFVLI